MAQSPRASRLWHKTKSKKPYLVFLFLNKPLTPTLSPAGERGEGGSRLMLTGAPGGTTEPGMRKKENHFLPSFPRKRESS